MRKAVGAGIVIGVAADLSSRIGGLWGALAFSIGLLVVCACGLSLFTGKVGAAKVADIRFLGYILAANVIGVVIVRLICLFPSLLVNSLWCGFLVHCGVVLFARGFWAGTIMCVWAFVAAGYTHCIAMVYSDPNAIDWLVVVGGNSLGALMANWVGIERPKEHADTSKN